MGTAGGFPPGERGGAGAVAADPEPERTGRLRAAPEQRPGASGAVSSLQALGTHPDKPDIQRPCADLRHLPNSGCQGSLETGPFF